MLDRQTFQYRQLRPNNIPRPPSPVVPPVVPPSEPQLQSPLSPGMQQARDEYRKTARKHPDALGGLVAQHIVQRSANDSRLEQLLGNYLAQPGLALSDLKDVLPIMDRVYAGIKLTNSMARLEYETRKVQSSSRDPAQRLHYNQDLENFHEKSTEGAAATPFVDDLLAGSELSPVPPAGQPATLPLSTPSEKSQK